MKFRNDYRSFIVFFLFWFSSIVLSGCEGVPGRTPPPDKAFAEDALGFSIGLNKSSYQIDEPIELIFKLKNISAYSLIVNRRFALDMQSAPTDYADIYCIVTGPSGQPINFSAYVTVVDIRNSHFVELQKDEVAESRGVDLRGFYTFNEPGKYSIRATYQNQLDPDNGLVAWKGSLVSNTVTFTIVP